MSQDFLYNDARFQSVAGDTWRPGGEELTRHGLDLCGFVPGANVVDIGCGTGATVRILRSLGICGFGVDRQAGSRSDAVQMLAEAANLPLLSGSLDGVTCECVLSLMADPRRVLTECRRVTRVGGKLLLADVFLREQSQESSLRQERASCLDGAVSLDEQAQRLQQTGWRVLVFEDHTRKLTELAARLIWYGADGSDLSRWLGARCSGTTKKTSLRRYGYGLWIAEADKEVICIP